MKQCVRGLHMNILHKLSALHKLFVYPSYLSNKMFGQPTQHPQLAKTMENPFFNTVNLDVIFRCYQIRPAEKIFCFVKLDCEKQPS